ncbi:helix-turn-helix domain-containing protein [Nocardia sp. NPDC050718]|uniref:PucR family transcriptional regulator n=1 Tax=Nocardia sp. NPDC050718 TaxID=3155788 RepID=UPI00340AF89A
MRYNLIDHELTESESAEVIALLRAHNAEVSRAAIEAIETELADQLRPLGRRDHEIGALIVQWCNTKFLDLLEDDETPLTDLRAFLREVGRTDAAEGFAPELRQTAFRIGTGVSIARFAELSMTLPAVTAATIGQVAQQVLIFQNTVMAALREGYADVAAGGERTRQRSRLLELLIDPEPDLPAIRAAAAAAEWPLPETVAAVAVDEWTRDPFRRSDIDIPADWVSGLHLERQCFIVTDPGSPETVEALRSLLQGRIGAIGPTVDPGAVADSLNWALCTLNLVRGSRIRAAAPVRALDYVPDLLISENSGLVAGLAAEQLAPLAGDGPEQYRLAETLLACLECRFNAPAAARRLGVHAQTVRHRVRRLNELFGEDLHLPDRQMALQIAVRHWLLTHRPENAELLRAPR